MDLKTNDSRKTGSNAISATDKDHFDLIVIGGGVNGSGIARDAAIRGLKTLLVEREDFSSGTSGRSGRMIHGGLRYLEHGDIGLVWESLKERATLQRIAPHLVYSQPLFIPFYRQNRYRPWMVRLGLSVLDIFAWASGSWMGAHRCLSRQETLSRIPALNPEGLTGSVVMQDAYSGYSERLCIENVIDAQRHGAVVQNYAEVMGLDRTENNLIQLTVQDKIRNREIHPRSRIVVNAAGPWVDRLLERSSLGETPRQIGGTKGSFLVVKAFPGAPEESLFYEARKDNRQVVVLRWNELYLIGSTDIVYEEDPADAVATPEEIQYLLAETNAIFPKANISGSSILFTFAGVRPLPYVGAEAGPTGKISRKHIIRRHPGVEGLLTIIGGKLSTFRSLAEETVNKIYKEWGIRPQPCLTAETPLPGAQVEDFQEFSQAFLKDNSLPLKTRQRLLSIYGVTGRSIKALVQEDASLGEIIDQNNGAIGAEVVWAFQKEHAQNLRDALLRRMMLSYDSAFDPAVFDAAVEVARKSLNWEVDRVEEERRQYENYLGRFFPESLKASNL